MDLAPVKEIYGKIYTLKSDVYCLLFYNTEKPDPWPHVTQVFWDAASAAPEPESAYTTRPLHPQLSDVTSLQSATESVEHEATAGSATSHAEPHQQQCAQGESNRQQHENVSLLKQHS